MTENDSRAGGQMSDENCIGCDMLTNENIALAKENARLREALKSIASESQQEGTKVDFWLNHSHLECANVCAHDTEIARAALEEKK